MTIFRARVFMFCIKKNCIFSSFLSWWMSRSLIQLPASFTGLDASDNRRRRGSRDSKWPIPCVSATTVEAQPDHNLSGDYSLDAYDSSDDSVGLSILAIPLYWVRCINTTNNHYIVQKKKLTEKRYDNAHFF